MGDFNDIMCMEEKRGGADQRAWLINGFNEAVSDALLHDLPLHGYPFTWERAKVNEEWTRKFPHAMMQSSKIWWLPAQITPPSSSSQKC